MAKYKIGVTEAGDAGLDLSWVGKLNTVDGAIVITKNPTDGFIKAVAENKDKLIVHSTITGYGSTVVEPNVPMPHEVAEAITNLISAGFPKERIVIRVDPIIPTKKGLHVVLDILESFMDSGFSRYRISVIDMYPHCRKRFENADLPLPYGDGFYPDTLQLQMVDSVLSMAKKYWEGLSLWLPQEERKELRIECCAEPGLSEPIQCGCISKYDLNLLGLNDDEADSLGFQRKSCMCYSGKTELLQHKARCPHGCLYCYWR